MKTHKKVFQILLTDLDEFNHVNNVKYVEWVNEIAKEHWLQLAPKSILEHYFWVLIKHKISYKSPALLNDNILLKTFVRSTQRVTSTRIVEVYNNSTQKLLALSETKWCFMNMQSKKPTRIVPDVFTLFC